MNCYRGSQFYHFMLILHVDFGPLFGPSVNILSRHLRLFSFSVLSFSSTEIIMNSGDAASTRCCPRARRRLRRPRRSSPPQPPPRRPRPRGGRRARRCAARSPRRRNAAAAGVAAAEYGPAPWLGFCAAPTASNKGQSKIINFV